MKTRYRTLIAIVVGALVGFGFELLALQWYLAAIASGVVIGLISIGLQDAAFSSFISSLGVYVVPLFYKASSSSGQSLMAILASVASMSGILLVILASFDFTVSTVLASLAVKSLVRIIR